MMAKAKAARASPTRAPHAVCASSPVCPLGHALHVWRVFGASANVAPAHATHAGARPPTDTRYPASHRHAVLFVSGALFGWHMDSALALALSGPPAATPPASAAGSQRPRRVPLARRL
jgi:hypothetical protein